jgi:site-specific recombinase XerD
VSERGAPLLAPGFSRMIERAAVAADLGIKAHAHMLRHACGYKLANDGRDTRAIELIGTSTGCARSSPAPALKRGVRFTAGF